MNKIRLLAFAFGFAVSAAVASTASSEVKPQTWDEFWLAHQVDPPPPRNFMGSPPANLQVLNLTNGAIDDAAARRWAEADLRRGHGDGWAACNLRLDIVNAGVLGPPGLNGTDQMIQSELEKGTKSLTCDRGADVEKMAVIAVSKEMRAKLSDVQLTPYVIVIMSRVTGVAGTRILADGRKEQVQQRMKKGERIWQLDTGQIHDNAAIGQLWYQANGWSCRPEGDGALAELCGLVKP